MRVIVNHSVPRSEAIQRIQTLLTELKHQAAGHIEHTDTQWRGSSATFSLRLRGLTVRGTIVVAEQTVTVQGKLPSILKAWQREIESAIRQRAEILLGTP